MFAASQADGTLGGGGIDDVTLLGDFNDALGGEASCGLTGAFHFRGPSGRKNGACCLARANGRGCGALLQ
ncbi:MAG: hypothetical protein RLZZ224_1723 [Verrucomicrobiota bacterium]|jgi:hypothetical protein